MPIDDMATGPAWPPKWAPSWRPNDSAHGKKPQRLSFSRRSSLGLSDSDQNYFQITRGSLMSPQSPGSLAKTQLEAPVPITDHSTESTPLFSNKDPLLYTQRRQLSSRKAPEPAPPWRDVAVCALAYFIGSLFVFCPPISGLISSTSSKHLVATSTVWFHPARPFGNTLEVFRYAAIMMLFALAVALLSILVSYGLAASGHCNLDVGVLLVVSIGGGLGTIGFLKQKVNNPSFNTACSLAIIFLVNLLLKNDVVQSGSLPFRSLWALFSMVLYGAIIVTIVAIIFRRQRATDMIEKDADAVMLEHADMLHSVLARFLDPKAETDEGASFDTNSVLKSTKQHLSYAKLELGLLGKRGDQRFQLLSSLVKSLKSQSRHLGSLMYCVRVKQSLLRPISTNSSSAEAGHSSNVGDTLRRISFQKNSSSQSQISADILFDSFVYQLGSSLDSFCNNISTSLLSRNADGLEAACVEFRRRRERALASVYRHRLFGPRGKLGGGVNDEAVVATCSMFSTVILDFAEQVRETLCLRNSNSPQVASPIESPQTAELRSRQANADLPVPELARPLSSYRTSDIGVGPSLWRFLRALRRVDFQHGIRVGVGAVVLSAPAFIESTSPWFRRFHGEWAITTYMLIMARNLGAMRKNIPLRILGTCTGALAAVFISTLFPSQPIPLAVSGALIALACFRKILSSNNPVLGRFILLAYNLVCLSGYSLSHHDRDPDDPEVLASIYDVAFHRVLAVVTGVMWAVFITVSIWPHSARRALRANLSILWMRMGLSWKTDPVSHTGGVIPGESELQNMMLDLNALLSQSPSEFRLRGRFDPKPYEIMIQNTQDILDAFHCVNLMTGAPNTPLEMDLIQKTRPECVELSSTLFLHFYTASASIRLGFPVPEYLPQSDDAATKLVAKLQDIRSTSFRGAENADSDDFVLLYSYLMATITISDRLGRINDALCTLFGALDLNLLSHV